MMHVVRKIYWDYDREEKWLNEMAANGLALRARAFFVYVFEDTPKNEFSYKVELLKNPPAHPETKKFIEFLEDTGIEFVAEYHNVAYFRKKTSEGELIIYSDMEPKIRQYKKQFQTWMIIGCFCLFVLVRDILSLLLFKYVDKTIYFIEGSIFILLGILPLSFIIKLKRKISTLRKNQLIKE